MAPAASRVVRDPELTILQTNDPFGFFYCGDNPFVYGSLRIALTAATSGTDVKVFAIVFMSS